MKYLASIISFVVSIVGAVSISFAQKVNFVFILVDDLGFLDVGYMNQNPNLNTPNINRLAGQGVMFSNAYAASPVCSPTRASILTGKYPATLKITNHIPGRDFASYLELVNENRKMMDAKTFNHLSLSETTFALIMKESGYRTAFFGKWHLAGDGYFSSNGGLVLPEYHPDKHGFEINIGGNAYGQPVSYFSPYYNDNIIDGPDGEYLTDRLTNEVIKFIESNKDTPFFAFLCTYAVHTPWQAPKELVEFYDGDIFSAMIHRLDENIGKIVNSIDSLGIRQNTLIIFSSDNGAFKNLPFRGGKGSLLEGGIRVPLILSLPGVFDNGRIAETVITSPDFFPTFMELSQIDKSFYQHLNIEGVSILELLRSHEQPVTRPIYWHFPHNRLLSNVEKSMSSAIRYGDYKLIWEFSNDNIELFDLKNDPYESNNLSQQMPNIADTLWGLLNDWLKITNANLPTENPEYSGN